MNNKINPLAPTQGQDFTKKKHYNKQNIDLARRTQGKMYPARFKEQFIAELYHDSKKREERKNTVSGPLTSSVNHSSGGSGNILSSDTSYYIIRRGVHTCGKCKKETLRPSIERVKGIIDGQGFLICKSLKNSPGRFEAFNYYFKSEKEATDAALNIGYELHKCKKDEEK